MYTRHIITSLLFLFFTGFALVGKAETITIKGIIVNDRSESLPAATVQLNDGEFGMVTGQDGRFEFNGLPAQVYKLQASYMGYETYTRIIEPGQASGLVAVRLTPSEMLLEGVEVSENRQQIARRVNSISVEHLQADFFSGNQAGSLMRTLRRIPGVHSMDAGTGMSKPMIRGLGFYRVVFAQNGIKQSGQLWNQHIGISIDQHAISQMEIIKGPSSLRYGSDAIGGVINILPAPIPAKGQWSADVSLTAKSNTEWMGASTGFSGRWGDVYIHLQATHNRFGDFRVPGTDVFLLPAPAGTAEATHEVELGDHAHNTAGEETGISLVTGIVRPWGNSYFDVRFHTVENGFFDYVGLQHASRREEHMASTREVKLPYQSVSDYSINHFTNRYFGENKLEIALGYQFNSSTEHSRLTDRTGNRYDDLMFYREKDNLELQLDLHNITANTSYSFRHLENHLVDMILHTGYEQNSTDGFSHILPDYSRASIGAGLIHQYELSPRWIINSGMRFDYHLINMKESLNPDPAFGDSIFNPQFEEHYLGTAFSLGANYIPNPNNIFKAHIGKSFRVPAIYELGAYGLHRHEGRFERGDLSIKPEEAWQLDLGYELETDGLRIMLSPFANYFTNYLFLNPTAELRSEGQVYRYHQSEALLYGGEASVEYEWRERVNLYAGIEYVYALNLDLKRSLPFTSPMSAITGLEYAFADRGIFSNIRVGIEGVLVGAQNNTVPNELSTPGHFSLNMHASTLLQLAGQQVDISLRVNNALDNRYYDHISFYRRMRIPEPGRDVQLFVKIPINK